MPFHDYLTQFVLILIAIGAAHARIYSFDDLKPEYLISYGVISDTKLEDYISQHQSDKSSVELMVLKNESYVCLIPSTPHSELPDVIYPPGIDRWNFVTSERDEAERKKNQISDRDIAKAKEDAIIALSPLSNQCIYYRWGWWTCSFCYNKNILQFHQSDAGTERGNSNSPPKPDEGSDVYTLGNFDNLKTSANSSISAHSKDIKIGTIGKAPHLIYSLRHGTLCELTGLDRTTEVQFYCSTETKTDVIVGVKELRSCHYQVAIATPRLCTIPMFVPPQKSKPNMIDCKKIIPEKDFIFSIPAIPFQEPAQKQQNILILPSARHIPSVSVQYHLLADMFKDSSDLAIAVVAYRKILDELDSKLPSENVQTTLNNALKITESIATQLGFDDPTHQKLRTARVEGETSFSTLRDNIKETLTLLLVSFAINIESKQAESAVISKVITLHDFDTTSIYLGVKFDGSTMSAFQLADTMGETVEYFYPDDINM